MEKQRPVIAEFLEFDEARRMQNVAWLALIVNLIVIAAVWVNAGFFMALGVSAGHLISGMSMAVFAQYIGRAEARREAFENHPVFQRAVVSNDQDHGEAVHR